MPHRFEVAADWVARFDAPERDAWQRPDEVIAALAIGPGAVVADLGAGTGYFAVRLARRHPEARVLGLDVEPDMVRHMTERAAKEGLTNLAARVSPPNAAALDEGTTHVLVVDTLHHIDGRVGYFQRLRARLAPTARLAIVDFRLESDKGPPRQWKLPPERVTTELAEAGFSLVARHEFLPDQYFLVFQPR